MDKANQVLRRSSIRIRSLKTGHSDLNMIISDIKGVRASCKQFTSAQKILVDDMSKWASHENNLALQETFHYLSDLSDMWYEAQRQFIGNIKKLQLAFESILESECHLDKSKAYLASREAHEVRLKKEENRIQPSDLRGYNERLTHAVACTAAAQQEVSTKVRENEVLKIVKVKEGLTEVSDIYLQLAHKSSAIFLAHAKIVDCIPNINGMPIESVKYTGSATSRRAIIQAKSDVHNFKRESIDVSAPPPYTSNPSSPNSFFGPAPSLLSHSENDGRYCEISELNNLFLRVNSPQDDTPRQLHEDLAGAIGGINITQYYHRH